MDKKKINSMGVPLTTAQWNAIDQVLKEAGLIKENPKQELIDTSIEKVWEVVVFDCESCFTVCICSTKEIALKKMFKYRDDLVKEYKDLLHMDKERYGDMISALEGNDYKNWHTYPHECPSIIKTEVITD